MLSISREEGKTFVEISAATQGQASRIQVSILIWKHQLKATHPFQDYILEKNPSKAQPNQEKYRGFSTAETGRIS